MKHDRLAPTTVVVRRVGAWGHSWWEGGKIEPEVGVVAQRLEVLLHHGLCTAYSADPGFHVIAADLVLTRESRSSFLTQVRRASSSS